PPGAQADLSVSKTAQATYVPGGGTVVYTIVVANAGPDGVVAAGVVDLVPAALQDVQWTCASSGGGSCTPSGSGSLDELVDLPAGAMVTFTMSADFLAGPGEEVVNTAMVTAPPETTDPQPKNNESTAVIGAE